MNLNIKEYMVVKVLKIVRGIQYSAYSRQLKNQIENEGGLTALSKDISLPFTPLVEVGLVLKNNRIASIGATAFHTARLGRSIGKDISYSTQVYKKCELALGAPPINPDLAKELYGFSF